jgi:uncharacterized iron-regulated protein
LNTLPFDGTGSTCHASGMRFSTLIVPIAATVLATCLTACGPSGKRQDKETLKPTLPADVRSAVTIFDRDGQRTDWSSMRAALSGADVVVIGETHGQPLGLEAAACIYDDAITDRAGSKGPALLLEFFERDEQLAIDDYLAGVTDQAAFRKAAGRTLGNYPPGHARMLEAAKAAGLPVVAANAPRRYVRLTTADGYEKLAALSSHQQVHFVIPDPLVQGDYKDRFFALMGGMSHGTPETEHGIPPEMINKMYHSQQMWDATMADSVAAAGSEENGVRPVVLVIGRFHSDFDGGTVQLIHRYASTRSVKTVSMVESAGSTLEEDDLGRADFVIYVGN